MKKVIIIFLLSLFNIINAADAAILEKGDGLAPLVAPAEEKIGRRSSRLSPLTPDGGFEFKKVVPDMAQKGGEEAFVFRFSAPSKSSAGELQVSSGAVASLCEEGVFIKTTGKITHEKVFTGQRKGKPFILALAQSEDGGAGDNLLIMNVDPSSSNGHASSFLPGRYKEHIEHGDDDEHAGGVTVIMCLRLGDHEQERAVTFNNAGEIVKDRFIKNPYTDLSLCDGIAVGEV